MKIDNQTRWITNKSEFEGDVRLFCFPSAGGGSVTYYPWRDVLRPEIELLLVHLPGREQRLREPLITEFAVLVEKLADELIKDAEEKPFAFFGHSMGALVAFEVARELRRRYNLLPKHLFLSGFRGAHLKDPDPPCSDLPENAFIEYLDQFDGIPELVKQDNELRAIFLPILRADFKILETYDYQIEPPLSCPITVFGGKADAKFTEDVISQWKEHTCHQFNSHYYPGGHFFINGSKSMVLEKINSALVG